jgi:RDD family
VTDDAGRRISAARAFGRWFAKWFFNWFVLWVVSMVTIAASKEKKVLHDFAARTLVVRGRPVPGGSLESWRILGAFGIPFLYLLGMYLTGALGRFSR